MIKYIIVVFFVILFNVNNVSANENLFEGDWNYEIYLDNNELPYNVFTINLKINKDNKVIGELCSISHYGKKIDCPINFSSQLINDKISFSFDSNFGGLNGQGLIQISNCFLKWTLVKVPEGESYLPKKAVLVPDKITLNNSIPNCPSQINRNIILHKSYLFNSPNPSDVTKMYLIKGDKVKFLQYDNDYFYIEYITNKNKVIRKWINCSGVDACNLVKDD